MPNERTDRKWAVVIGGIVAMTAIVAATVLGLTISSPESDSTPVLVTLLGFVAPTVVALLALLKGLDNQADIRENTTKTNDLHDKVTNGFLDLKMRRSVTTALEEAVDNGILSGEQGEQGIQGIQGIPGKDRT
jgi:hypothetical protein